MQRTRGGTLRASRCAQTGITDHVLKRAWRGGGYGRSLAVRRHEGRHSAAPQEGLRHKLHVLGVAGVGAAHTAAVSHRDEQGVAKEHKGLGAGRALFSR
jgi:hypothetical protein